MHPTGSARSGPPPDRPAASAPPPPPRWRNWLLFIGLLLTAALFLLPIPQSSNVEQLGYSQLKSDIAAGQVSSVALGPDGSVSGQLTSGTKFTSSYPVGLQDPQFAQLLHQHNVYVTTQPARTSTWSVLLNLLPLAVIVALFVWSGRVIDEEVTTLLREAEQRATVILTNHRHALDRLTDLLLERETIDGAAVAKILGRIPNNRGEPAGATAST